MNKKTVGEFKEELYFSYQREMEIEGRENYKRTGKYSFVNMGKEAFADFVLKTATSYASKGREKDEFLQEDVIEILDYAKRFCTAFLNPQRDQMTTAEVMRDISNFVGRTFEFFKLLREPDLCAKEKAELLLSQGININSRRDNSGEPPLTIAIKKGYGLFVDLLLRYHADPNVRDLFGKTPLYHALATEDWRLSKYKKVFAENLIEYGASITDLDKNGTSAVALAMSNNDRELVDYLFSIGAKVEGNLFDEPILNMLIKDSAYDMFMQAVNKADTNLETRDSFGNTPLLTAAEKETNANPYAIELIKRGVDVNAQNNAGLTVLMMAYQNENFELFKTVLATGKADLSLTTKYFPKRVIDMVFEDDSLRALDFQRALLEPKVISTAKEAEQERLQLYQAHSFAGRSARQ